MAHRSLRYWVQRLGHRLQGVVLLLALAGLLGIAGALVAGTFGAVLALLLAGAVSLFGPRMSAAWILRRARARGLPRREAPVLHDDLQALARAAKVETPKLYVTADPRPNAMMIGDKGGAAVAVSLGLLRTLDREERRAVLAHELAHLANGDLALMRGAAVLEALSRSIARWAMILAVLQLPLVLFGAPTLPFSALLFLVAVPWMSRMLSLALSRTREFDADLRAVALGDASGHGTAKHLARALRKLESLEASRRRWSPFVSVEVPEWPRSHPATKERVARLEAFFAAGGQWRGRKASRRGREGHRQPSSRGAAGQPKTVVYPVHRHGQGSARSPKGPVLVVARPSGYGELRIV